MGKNLIKQLRSQQWEIWAEGNRLFYRHPGEAPQHEILEKIKNKKSEVLQALAEEGSVRVISATPAQFALWFTYQLHPAAAGAHNTAYAWSLDAPIDAACMQLALGQLLERHSCLRSTFLYEDEKLFQVIHANVDAHVDYVDARSWTEADIWRYSKEYYQRPFDLTNPQLVRVLLIDCPDHKHHLMVVADHIAADGYSYTILIGELEKLYSAALNKTPVQLPPLTSSYSDFIYTQHNILNSAIGEKQKKYWQQQLAGHHFALDLPTDHPRPHDYSYQGASYFFELPAELTSQLKHIAKKTSLNTLLMAAFHVFLYRQSGQDDVLVGTPVPGRTSDSPWSQVVGYFVNVLVIRGKVTAATPFSEFAQKIYREFIEAVDNQDYPFIKLVTDLQPDRDTSRTPIFQSSFVLQKSMGADGITENVPPTKLFWNQFNVNNIDIPLTEGQTDLSIEMVETQKSLHGYFKYNSDLFEPTTVARFLSHFTTLLESIAANPNQLIDDLSILGAQERRMLVDEWNKTQREYPQHLCIHQLVEQQVEKTPDNVAVVFEDQSLTYAELNTRANQLAHHLRTLGVGAETLVAIACERSLEIVVGMLGILKAGAAYVPLDPAYPKDRLAYMLEDSAASVLLTQSWLKDLFSSCAAKVINLDQINAELSTYPLSNPLTICHPHSLAYVIYTSGSTGKPKGVMIEQHSIVNRLFWWQNYIPLNSSDSYLHQFSFAFDGAVVSLFWPLLNGTKVVIPSDLNLSDPLNLARIIQENRVTSMLGTPSFMLELLTILHSVKTHNIKRIMFAGEALPPKTAEATFQLCNEVFNFYGPTESSIIATAFLIEKSSLRPTMDRIPIGRAVANTSLYLLNDTLHPVPIGVIGELYIGGDGLARGYLNRPELTAERFIPNPFMTPEERAQGCNTRLYRTGDLCRYLEDGNIEYIGRIDHQVKIRGFRIELDEIESALLSHPAVVEATVIAREDELGNKRLVAYYVSLDDTVGPSLLRELLKASLPAYMIPAFFVSLEAMPLTPNGKLDRKALPAPEIGEIRQAYVAPRTHDERNLVSIWQDTLHLDKIGIHDNFFEMGGDSIVSIQLISRARQKGIHLRARDIFQHPTIAGLAELIAMETSAPALVTKDNEGDIPLLPIGHWFANLQLANPHHFNQDYLLVLASDINIDPFKEALKDVFTHHDAFRIRLNIQTLHQWYMPSFSAPVIETQNLSNAADFDTALNDYANELQSSLNIETGPIYRIALIDGAPDHELRLLMVIHHLAVDGVSWRILLDDLTIAYAARLKGTTPVLPVEQNSVKDWSQLLLQATQDQHHPITIAAQEYWLNAQAPAEIHQDYTQEEAQHREERVKHFSWNLTKSETSTLLTELPKLCHAQINEVLLATLLMVYREWSGRDRLTIRMEGHGREESFFGNVLDLSQTVGWHTSIYPVCLSLPDVVRSVPEILKAIREQLRQVPDNGIGYGMLRYFGNSEIREQLSQFDHSTLVFNYLGQFGENSEGLFRSASEPHGAAVAAVNNMDLRIDCNSLIANGQLHVHISYNTKYYDEESVAGFARQHHEALVSVLAQKDQLNNRQWLIPSDVPMTHFTQEQINSLLPADVINAYPLSPMQQGLLFHTLKDPHSGGYIIRSSFLIEGKLDRGHLRNAWERLTEQYDILRTSFLWEGVDAPVQLMHGHVELPWEELDWQHIPDWKSALNELYVKEGERGFDLTHAPLMRFYLITLAPNKTLLTWIYHHLLLDGWSTAILMSRLANWYQCLVEGRVPPVLPPVRYYDYIAAIHNQPLDEAKEYWSTYLDGFTELTVPSIKTTLPMGDDGIFRMANQKLVLDNEETHHLTNWAKQQGLTLNTLFQGIWGLVLHRQTGQQDIVFGNVVSGRAGGLANAQEQVGLLINTIPLRIQFNNVMTGLDYLTSIQQQLSTSQQYDYLPLGQIQSWAGFNAQAPLIDHLFMFENYPIESRQQDSALYITDIIAQEQTNYTLNVVVLPGKELTFRLDYDERFYQQQDIARLMGHVRQLLEQIVAKPQEDIQNYDLLTPAERQQLLIDWNDTTHAYPRDKTIHQLFEEQAKKTPHHVAVVFEEQSLTYEELNARANQLAYHLRTLGVGAETLVAIACERSLEMIIGVIGILKAGGVYVPLDPTYPKDRLAYMLKDSNATLILTQSWLKEELPENNGLVIALDQIPSLLNAYPEENPPAVAMPHNLAYVIYTSGSTGKPKGVMIENGSLLNILIDFQQQLQINDQTRWLSVTSLSFDIAGLELYLPLISGGTIILPIKEDCQSGDRLVQLIKMHDITVMQATPSTWQLLDMAHWKGEHGFTGLCGGEAMSASLKQYFNEVDGQYFNVFGPTETTIWSTIWPVDKSNSCIGHAIANTQTYILNDTLRPVPVGVVGELYIGGDGLARGYLNRPELTSERFIPNPFMTSEDHAQGRNTRLYRTGDLCRYLADGNIDYIGRIDHQVKIRGFRIEIGEIESALLSHLAIRETVVLAREDEPGNKRLVAYYVSAAAEVGAVSLREHLKATLPSYMIPAFFVPMNSMPLTPNGKLDRKALPKPEGGEIRTTYVAPRTLIEMQVAAVFQEILHADKIGVHDNFFDLGGDSILGVKLTVIVMDHFGIQFPLRELFNNQTVEKIAEYLVNTYTKSWSPIIQLNNKTDNNVPIFFCFTLQGIGSVYAKLSTIIEPDFLCYALESRGYSENKNPHSDMVEMAAYYIDEIKKIQKEGPYRIVAWSFGGLLAVEIGRQLTEAGDEVKNVVMLDTPNTGHPPLAKALNKNEEEDENVALNDLTITVRHIEDAHREALKTFRPNEIAFPLTLIRAKDEVYPEMDDDSLGWRPYTTGCSPFDIYNLDGKHNDMLDRDKLPEVSRMLKEILKS